MITDIFGIFSGGNLSLDATRSRIVVGATILCTPSGKNIGFGKGGRQIMVGFGAPVFNYDILHLSDLDAATYQLSVGATAGSASIAYDDGVTGDIVVTQNPSATMVVFGTVSWPANANNVSQLTIDLSTRRESRIIMAADPINANDLYDPGMDFADVSFNAPLVNMSVLSQVLQGEIRARAGDHFAIVLAKRSDVQYVGGSLQLNPIRIVMRDMRDGIDTYKVIATKEPYVFPTIPVDATTIGKRIFIWVDPVRGLPGADVQRLATDVLPPAGSILVAYGDIPSTATGPQDVIFSISTEISQANAQTGADIALNKATHPSGFVAPIQLLPTTTAGVLNFPGAISLINGVQYNVPAQVITLPAQPAAGTRLDLMFLEAYQVIEASAPTDGSAYVSLLGVGYLVARSRISIATGVTHDYPEAMMLQSDKVSAVGGGNFIQDLKLRHFASPYSQTSYDGYSYALPMAIVNRFSTETWSLSAPGGGVGRPDAKNGQLVHPDELAIIAPVVSLQGINYLALFGRTLDALLKGNHPAMLGASHLGTGYSKRPLQMDAISAAPVTGANTMGIPDGVRRNWSASPQPYNVGGIFNAGVDRTAAPIIYQAANPSTVTLTAPGGGRIGKDTYGVAAVEMRWASTYQPVAIVGGWALGANETTASAVLDRADANFQPTGTISLTYTVTQTADSFLAEMPESMYAGSIGSGVLLLAALGAAAIVTPLSAGETQTVNSFGAPGKGDAALATTTIASPGSTTLALPVSYLGRQVLGAISATLVGGGAIAIQTVTLGTTQHVLTLTQPLSPGALVKVTLALGGRIANYEPKNRGIGEFAESLLVSNSITGGSPTYYVPLVDTRTGLQNMNRVFIGAMSVSYDPTAPAVTSAYVNGRLYPATFRGAGKNLIQVDLTLSDDEYKNIGAAQNDWSKNSSLGLWTLKPGTTYDLKLPILWSDAPQPFEVTNITYSFKPLFFLPVVPGQGYDLAYHGRVLISNSSIANRWKSNFAPASERFPLVRGTLKAAAQANPDMTFSDVLELGQDGDIPFDGERFTINGRFKFHAGVFDANSGFVVWAALVKVNRMLRMFFYVVEGDTFDVANEGRAFLSYPVHHAAE